MRKTLLIAIFIGLFSSFVWAQTTAFNFQGRLNDGTSPANGRYDLEFRLYNGLTGDNIVGTAISKPNLMLVNGVFSTQLDFGAAAFSGADRFIEIRLRQTAMGGNPPNAYVVLGPRQQILSVPYTIRSLKATLADDATHSVQADNATNATNATTAATANNALNLGGIPAANYVQKSSNGLIVSVTPINNLGLAQQDTQSTVAVGTYVGSGTNASTSGWFGTVTNHPLRFFTNVGTSSQPTATLTLDTTGNLSQPVSAFGLPKAMAEVDKSGAILRCFNSTLAGSAATTAPCGITINHFTAGGYGMNFGFPATDRFLSITPTKSTYYADIGGNKYNGGAYYIKQSSGNVDVRTYVTDETQTTFDIGYIIIIF